MNTLIEGSARGPDARNATTHWDKSTRVLIGSCALALTLVVVRSRRRRADTDAEKSGVWGTILKSALLSALSTVPKLELLRLARHVLRGEPRATVAVGQSPVAAGGSVATV